MVLAGTWGPRPLGKLHPPTPFCTPPLAPGQERSTSTAAPATLAACAARQGGCCERLHGPPGTHGPVRARSGAAMQLAGPARAAGLQLGTSQPACSQGPSLLHECRTSLQRLGAPARPTSCRVARACVQSKRGAAQKRSPRPVCGPASSAGQGAASAGTEGRQAPQNTQWRAPDSPSTQPCLRRKLLASLARARRHLEPSGSPVQACGRLGPGAGRQHGTLGSQQMVLAGFWGARPPGKLHPPTPFCTPPLAPGQERSTSTAAPATLAACAARQGGCCRRLHGVGRSVPVRGLRCSSPAPARAAGLQLGTSQPACSQGPSLLHECRTSLQRLGAPARPTSRRVATACRQSKRGAAQKRSPRPVCGPASSAGQGAAGAGVEGYQAPQNTQWRAPDSPSTQPCLRRKLLASLARARRHSEPSGLPVQACGRLGPGAGRQHGTWGSQQMVLAGTWAPPRKVTPAYPMLHPATCSWARAQHVHRSSSHAGSLCCEAGRLLREAARCGPVSARSGAAMQLAGPCAGSRAAAGHLPASLFTGSKPPTRVPNQSAALGRSSTPHKSQSRHSLSSIQARRRSEAIAAAGVRSGIISWAGRCRRGRGGISGTPEHAMARARLTINAALSPQEAAGQPGARTEATRALRLACAGLWTPRARCWSPARNMGVAANGSCGDLGGAPPGKVTPAYPILHPATCSWARAQHVHRGSSHAGSLCCEAGRLLREAARRGPVSARSGAAMQLAGPCAGSRAAAGHLPASLLTGSKPPTRVPNQSAALGRSSTPHKPQSLQSLSSIQARRRSEAIAAAGVRSGIISWAGRCRRGHGGTPGTPEHAMARARLTIKAALSPQEAAG